ncbi:N-acetylmuramoyl-L-alanine amidase [Haloimpatiens sp. FM7330]|uniref:N-acetylmuramoyl-L-alanine amidase n=1 Tax=Haloimpatiens sp. FM7330 TaxID=3298610 RepID=UPI003639D72A
MKSYKRLFGIFTFLLFTFMCSHKASAVPVIKRTYGNDRYKTAIAISQKNWNKADNVIIASGKDFPDSLCSAPLSKKLNAPIILIQNTLTNSIKSEIRRLGAKKVYIIGGTGVIPKTVESQIQSMKLKYERIAGKDRYATSIAIANKLGTVNKVFVALGLNFPDALSVGPIAGRDNIPIILVENNKVPTDAKNYLKGKSITKSYVMGGPKVISEGVTRGIPNSERIYGSDRYGTNYKVLQKFSNNTNLSTVYVASGKNFPDALAGTAIAVRGGLPIVLVDKKMNNNSANFLKSKLNSNSVINVFGGTAVVSNEAVKPIVSNNLTVCIDPGHGGSDSGSVGSKGTKEKDVDLNVALKVGKILSDSGIKVKYTRSSDKSVSSSERKKIANSSDLSVSIHVNSYTSSNVNGVETFYLQGSSSSQKLASDIQNQLVTLINMTNRGAKQDTRHAEVQTTCPSTLVLLGFMTNANDENKLRSVDFQNKSAQAIANGILEYVGKSPSIPKVTITSISDITKTVQQGSTYRLPSTVTATMSDNSQRTVNITWNTSVVNTSKTGTYVYEGTVYNYGRKVRLTLTVTPKESKPDDGKIVFCIDPGHGGYDTGAIGPTGIREKDVTLPVGLKVGQILSQNGIKVVYTRTSDNVSWPSNEHEDLVSRVNIAENSGADYFLSIHCNSFGRPSAYGTETYYNTSNNSGGVSQKLAQAIQNELVKDLNSYNRGVKTANYYVNKYASCPSVLTELGFLSNPEEEALLKTSEYQTKCAKAIADAILNFVKK